MDAQEMLHMLHEKEVRQYQQLNAGPLEGYDDMSQSEMKELIKYLMKQLEEANARAERLEKRLEERDRLDEEARVAREKKEEESQAEIRRLIALVQEMGAYKKENAQLRQALDDERSQKNVSNKHLYGSKSLKSKAKPQEKGRDEDKDNFDGTPESVADPEDLKEDKAESQEPSAEDIKILKETRPYRVGLIYNLMDAACSVLYTGRELLAGEGQLIKKYIFSTYKTITKVIKQSFTITVYKDPFGVMHNAYLPKEGDPVEIACVPGTHADPDFLADLIYDRYVLDITMYRDIQRFMDDKMHVSRQTLHNWLHKGGLLVAPLIEELKNRCIQKDAIINCDETWCKVKKEGTYRKGYIWCLVNKAEKTVIYCYEEGSRSRKALKDIIGDRDFKAMQSDGYNVYMFIDKELVDVVHLCCMDHVRAKFKYAKDQAKDRTAEEYLDLIGQLYGLEREYKEGKLTPEQITACRQGLKTKEILIRLRSLLDRDTSPDHPPRGAMMERAIRYMNMFWTQLMNYLKDGRFDISNAIAERFIRPLAGQRKNALFYGSHKMARTAAMYNTLISTCRMVKISVRGYLRKVMNELSRGSQDYANLLPMTIGKL